MTGKWLMKLFKRSHSKMTNPLSFHPELEILENRTLPATFTWTGLGDFPSWEDKDKDHPTKAYFVL